ncbi:DHH family phosphoesterase, partial [Mycoplasmopsis bovis]|uniref:DHH family phosphoesterase n=1 Tax=Mycoplasmopsis bovis TaxID=28903 RepID=UPI003D29DF48
LKLASTIIPSDLANNSSLGIIVDANFKERIYLRQYLDKNLFAETLRIDHHPNDDDLDKCTRWVESNRIAAAEHIFLGIVTDSGRFLYPDTSARTHQ